MIPDDEAAHRKIKLAVAATETGAVFFSGSDSSAQFDRGCDHVCGLLRDAYTLFTAGSFPTVVFSITAIEEIAKLEIAAFRRASHGKRSRCVDWGREKLRHQLNLIIT